jgi:hypothetical protein
MKLGVLTGIPFDQIEKASRICHARSDLSRVKPTVAINTTGISAALQMCILATPFTDMDAVALFPNAFGSMITKYDQLSKEPFGREHKVRSVQVAYMSGVKSLTTLSAQRRVWMIPAFPRRGQEFREANIPGVVPPASTSRLYS